MGQDVLSGVDAELGGELRRVAEHRLRTCLGLEGRSRRGEEQSRRHRPVDAHVGEDVLQGRDQRLQERLVEEASPHPLHEDPVVREVLANQLEELAGVEMRGGGGPRMRRLRSDGVVSLVCEQEGAARVVENELDPRIRQRVLASVLRDGRIGVDDRGLDLHHVDLVEVRWHRLHHQAAPESHDQDGAGVGTAPGREVGEPPDHHEASGSDAGPVDDGFAESVGAELPAVGGLLE